MSSEPRNPARYLPFVFALLLAAGIYIGSRMNPTGITGSSGTHRSNQVSKISDVINYIEQEYVDTVDTKAIIDKGIELMLQNLDPHSAYIPASNVQAANEPLEGNFEGIGIEFHIQADTIMVVSTIAGGPSDMVGLCPGDRIIKVNRENIAGTGITNNDVFRFLRGKSGTKVNVSVLRRNSPRLLDFTITRGKIPLNSIDAAYMADGSTGYIKLSRFAATTHDEFRASVQKLSQSGMTQMILDLRNNPGGYLDAAIKIADEFLPDKKTIVYTQGKARPKTIYRASSDGNFENGKVAVLIDEGSASASEIIAGALQDWDRAIIIGRRSYGKGLVQEQTIFPDSSALRLTIARYYTPTGRSIQKPYSNGYEDYEKEISGRFAHGELNFSDSIKFPEELKYKTPGGKIVYGGGGIMPDIFVPVDTAGISEYFNSLFRLGLISQFAYNYVDENRQKLQQFTIFRKFNKQFQISDELIESLVQFGESQGVKRDNEGLKYSGEIIKVQLKAFIARQLFRENGFFPVLNSIDITFQKAVEVIHSAGN